MRVNEEDNFTNLKLIIKLINLNFTCICKKKRESLKNLLKLLTELVNDNIVVSNAISRRIE